jgi:hypothetical protein
MGGRSDDRVHQPGNRSPGSLIRASATAAQGGETPYLLGLARQCERWGVVAVLGHDPPYRLIIQMTQAVYTYEVVKAIKSAVGADIHRVPAEMQRYYGMLHERGYV